MIYITAAFYMFMFIFALIGAMRGWAKELLVTFSVVLATAILTLLEDYVPPVRGLLTQPSTLSFWIKTSILAGLAFFGYQTPNLPKLSGARFARERLQDSLLGFVLGGINGYLIVGSIWYFMAQANYPFPDLIVPPLAGTPAGNAAAQWLERLPPVYLQPPFVYFAVFLAFAFVVIVFL